MIEQAGARNSLHKLTTEWWINGDWGGDMVPGGVMGVLMLAVIVDVMRDRGTCEWGSSR